MISSLRAEFLPPNSTIVDAITIYAAALGICCPAVYANKTKNRNYVLLVANGRVTVRRRTLARAYSGRVNGRKVRENNRNGRTNLGRDINNRSRAAKKRLRSPLFRIIYPWRFNLVKRPYVIRPIVVNDIFRNDIYSSASRSTVFGHFWNERFCRATELHIAFAERNRDSRREPSNFGITIPLPRTVKNIRFGK